MRYVYKNGTAIRSHLFTVKYVTNPHRKHSRFSVVVSKKVHKGAVGRNRIRRRLYEIIRQELPRMERVHDIAVIALSSETMSLPFAELEEALRLAFDQAGLYKKR